jgi:hypothetical protein
MANGRESGFNRFACPTCQALYDVVKVEAGPEADSGRQLTCRSCGTPLAARDGKFILKYFMLRTATKRATRFRRPALKTPEPPQ